MLHAIILFYIPLLCVYICSFFYFQHFYLCSFFLSQYWHSYFSKTINKRSFICWSVSFNYFFFHFIILYSYLYYFLSSTSCDLLFSFLMSSFNYQLINFELLKLLKVTFHLLGNIIMLGYNVPLQFTFHQMLMIVNVISFSFTCEDFLNVSISSF